MTKMLMAIALTFGCVIVASAQDRPRPATPDPLPMTTPMTTPMPMGMPPVTPMPMPPMTTPMSPMVTPVIVPAAPAELLPLSDELQILKTKLDKQRGGNANGKTYVHDAYSFSVLLTAKQLENDWMDEARKVVADATKADAAKVKIDHVVLSHFDLKKQKMTIFTHITVGYTDGDKKRSIGKHRSGHDDESPDLVESYFRMITVERLQKVADRKADRDR